MSTLFGLYMTLVLFFVFLWLIKLIKSWITESFLFLFGKQSVIRSDQENNVQSPEIYEDAISKQQTKKSSIFGEYSRYLYKKEYLMTKREAYFYRAIAGYLQDKDYIICPKVRVEDIIGIRSSYGFRPWKVSGRLDRSHIDFLLIGKTDLKNKFAIEVDDYSHDTFTGIERDNAKNEACAITGLPLIRFRDPNKIQEIFMSYGI